MVLFSIITITYNAEANLERTLQSVASQGYRGVEHLIIDGASTDRTLPLAQTYKAQSDAADNGHEVIIKSEPDHGLYDAMNKGLKQASGDYVLFLNAGDTLAADDTLEQVVARCRLTALPSAEWPAVLYGLTDITDDNGLVTGPRRFNRQLTAPGFRLNRRSFRHGMLVCHQAFFARADLARVTPYDLRYRYSADVDWCIRLMQEAEAQQLAITPVGITTARYQQEGQTTLHHRDSLRERFQVMRRHYGLFTTILMHLWFVFRK